MEKSSNITYRKHTCNLFAFAIKSSQSGLVFCKVEKAMKLMNTFLLWKIARENKRSGIDIKILLADRLCHVINAMLLPRAMP